MSVTLHTALGDLKIELACDKAPFGCSNFLAHCGMGTYVGTKFHRNLAGFCVQGGDPTGTGKGGETWNGQALATEDGLQHDKRGRVALAKVKKVYGSQFYITYAPQPHLDGDFTVIGQVIDGEDVMDALERVPVEGKKHRPKVDVEVAGITIHANPIADALVPLPSAPAGPRGASTEEQAASARGGDRSQAMAMDGGREAGTAASGGGSKGGASSSSSSSAAGGTDSQYFM